MKNTKKVIRSGGPLNIRIEMDPNEIFPNDPGQGTPVMVLMGRNPEFTGTWNCATSEGELDGNPIPPEGLDWLESKREEVEAWCEANGV